MEVFKMSLRPARTARIEIIPLIDVIFFLLATFVLFTLTLNRLQSLEVPLPYPGEKSELPPPVSIQVSEAGALFWNQEPIELADLPARISAYKATEKFPRVVINGDEKARLGTTVRVLDELRQADITRFTVETKTRPTGK